VKVSDISEGNKAWTNRVWSGGNYVISPLEEPAMTLPDYMKYVYKTQGVTGRESLFGQSHTPEGDRPIHVMACRRYMSFDLPQTVTTAGGDWECGGAYSPWTPNEARAYMDFRATASGTHCTTDADCERTKRCPPFEDIRFDAYGRLQNDPYRQFLDDVCCFKLCADDSDCGSSGGSCVDTGGSRHCTVPERSRSIAGRVWCEGNIAATQGVGRNGDDSTCPAGTVKLSTCGNTEDFCAEGGVCVQNFICDTALGFCRDPENPATILGGGGPEATDLSLAKKRLAQIFARSYGIQNWVWPTDDATGSYGDPDANYGLLTENNTKGWDITESGIDGVFPTPPTIVAVGPRCVGTECEEVQPDRLTGAVDPMTINGRTRGDIVSLDGKLKVNLKFYFYANPDQMPIKAVYVDFDGGLPEFDRGDDNFYKNYRGLKLDLASSECDGSDFGRTPEACATRYFSTDYIYICPKDGGTMRRCSTTDPNDVNCYNPACPSADVRVGGCCVFKPKVQIKDNWGWCNGNCGHSAGGCYDASDSGGIDECEIGETRFNHWTSFQGQVIVVPK
jgi:hypothetical protein